MTTEQKQEIRERINAICGGDIGEIKPEIFVSETKGDVRAFNFHDAILKNHERFTVVFYATKGFLTQEAIWHFGCN